MRQFLLIKNPVLCAGGALNSGKRKERRPLCCRRALHLVLKSDSHNLRENKNVIVELITKYAQRFHIRIYKFSVQKDHTHLLLKIPNRSFYYKFIRALAGVLARKLKITWKLLPFTRVIAWGKDFRSVVAYVQKNEEEIMGLRAYTKRKHRYPKLISGA